MRVSTKGQVTIPQAIRDQFGIEPGTELEFVARDEHVELRVSHPASRGERLVAAMRGSGSRRLTTDEIMALTRGDD